MTIILIMYVVVCEKIQNKKKKSKTKKSHFATFTVGSSGIQSVASFSSINSPFSLSLSLKIYSNSISACVFGLRLEIVVLDLRFCLVVDDVVDSVLRLFSTNLNQTKVHSIE